MIRQWLIEGFAQQLAQALEVMSGDKVPVTSEIETGELPGADDLIWEQPFSLNETTAWLAGPLDSWTAVGEHLLRAAGIEEHDDATAKSTFFETLNQAFSGLAREIGSRLLKSVKPAAGTEYAHAPDLTTWSRVEIRLSESDVCRFLLAFSSGLEELLEAAAHSLGPVEPGVPAVKTTSGITGVENSRTLELLLDVELPLSVSFGRAHLPIKDVIKLTTGSIVDLNRTVGEPVEVIVNNCVIARGEVVVVEGNFGVRIQEVISKQERLRTLY
jgi:flagellar motor switch protein FliN/FliY